MSHSPHSSEEPATDRLPTDDDADGPGAAVHGEEPPKTTGADLRAAAMVVAVLAFVGLPLGALWSWLTPRVELVRVPGGFGLAQENPEQYMAADGVFTFVGLAAGFVAAVLVWLLLSARRGPWLLSGLVLGSIASQVVAWKFGRLGRDEYLDTLDQLAVGWHVWRAPELKMVSFDVGAAVARLGEGDLAGMFDYLSLGVLVTMAFAAAFVYTVCAGWSRYSRLRAAEEPRPEPAWQPPISQEQSPRIRNTDAGPSEGRLPSLTC